jgi:hypothetical protein
MKGVAEQKSNVTISVGCPPGDFCEGKTSGGGLSACSYIGTAGNTVNYEFEDCVASVGSGAPDLQITITLEACLLEDCNN